MEHFSTFVELLDEGAPTLRKVRVTALGQGLYRLEADWYDPEDEIWAFLPGAIVALEEFPLNNTDKGLLVRNSDPNVIRIEVEGTDVSEFRIHRTDALHIGDGHYKILPTPHYKPEHHWKYPPGSIVALKKQIESDGTTSLIAVSVNS